MRNDKQVKITIELKNAPPITATWPEGMANAFLTDISKWDEESMAQSNIVKVTVKDAE